MRFATIAALCALTVASGCGARRETDPKAAPPVSGRTITGTGVSIDFPSGWSEVPGGVTPFTRVYRNKEAQLEVRCIEASSGGQAITTHGDQMKRGLAHDGTVDESGPVTIDGRPAYRAVVRLRTPTGNGVVVGVTIQRTPDRISTLYVASAGDERPGHRAAIDELLSTVEVN